MQAILKAVSLLLTYPTKELQETVPAIQDLIAEDEALNAAHKKLLDRLAVNLGGLDLYDAQERYVLLFDRSRSLSLHLFEHVHGESRDRGQAMVDLMAMYEADGFTISARELPDYLPLFLEYLSTKPAAEARETLAQTAHILAALRERLKKRKSVYANAFAVLEALSRTKPDAKLLSGLLEIPDDDPDDLEALDRIWEEEAVTFGGNAGENVCGTDRIQRQVRAHQRKPDEAAPATTS